MHERVNDLKTAMSSPSKFGEKVVHIRVGGIISDAPATSFVKGIVGHNGKYGCGKCKTAGEFHYSSMCLLNSSAEPRSNDDFLNYLDSLERNAFVGDSNLLDESVLSHIRSCSPLVGGSRDGKFISSRLHASCLPRCHKETSKISDMPNSFETVQKTVS